MKHIMLDIETLSTRSDAQIIQIGLLSVDDKWVRADRISATVDWSIQPTGHVDPETVFWWAKQSEAVRKGVFAASNTLTTALQFVFGGILITKADLVWANGTSFDIPILEHAFRSCGIQCPWQYWQTRDLRTLKSLVPKAVLAGIKNERAHDALADCDFQMSQLQACLEYFQPPVKRMARV